MWTLIDIKSGLIFHCERLTSAFLLRAIVGKGNIYKDGVLSTETAIKLARDTWKNDC